MHLDTPWPRLGQIGSTTGLLAGAGLEAKVKTLDRSTLRSESLARRWRGGLCCCACTHDTGRSGHPCAVAGAQGRLESALRGAEAFWRNRHQLLEGRLTQQAALIRQMRDELFLAPAAVDVPVHDVGALIGFRVHIPHRDS